MIDAIIGTALLVMVALIIRKLVLDKKRGVRCGSCPSTGEQNCDCE